MPSSSTTSITVGSLLDLIGPAAQSQTAGKDQRAFDALLQPATTPSPPPSVKDYSSSPPPTHRRDDTQAERPETPRDAAHDDGAAPNTVSADLGAAKNVNAKSDSADTKPADDQPQKAEQIVAESIAGLTAVVPTAAAIQPTPKEAISGDKSLADEIKPAATSAKKSGNVTANASPTAIQPAKATLEIDPQTASAKEKTAATEVSSAAKESESKLKTEAAGNAPPTNSTATKADESAAKGTESAIKTEKFDATNTPQSETQHKSDDSGRGNHPQPDNQPTLASALVNDPIAPVQDPTAPPIIAAPVLTTAAPDRPAGSTATSNSAGAIGGVSTDRARLPAELLAPRTANGKHVGAEVDATRLVNRVVRAISTAQERDGEVRLRLSPPELGSLRLDVRVQDGALVAHVQTETDAAKAAIIDNLPALRDRLAEQGVRIERFDVDLMQRQPGGMPDQPGNRQPEPQTPTQRLVLPQRATTVPPPSSSTSSLLGSPAGGLNVIV